MQLFKSITGKMHVENNLFQPHNQVDLARAINTQLLAISVIGFIFNLSAWAIWLKGIFKSDSLGSFMWFVVCPFCAQVFIALGLKLYTEAYSRRHSVEEFSATLCCKIVCSVSYALFFGVMFVFYYDMKPYWILAACPMILAAFFRDVRCLFISMVSTTVFLALSLCNLLSFDTYKLYDREVPRLMLVSEMLIIALIIGCMVFTMHYKVTLSVQKMARLEAAENTKDIFFSNISHELRTPISTILGMDEMILRENPGPETRKYAENIKSAGQNLLSQINDILDSSKLDSGKLEPNIVNYDLSSVIRDCYSMVQVMAKEKELEVHINCDPMTPKRLRGDRVRIKQIFIHLLTNAVRHTSQGYVEMDVHWRRIDMKKIDLILAVKDTGMGISVEGRRTLFEKYSGDSAHRYVEGTGLGLNITKQLVDMMQGTINVESEEGKGTTFTVSIPQEVLNVEVLGEIKPGSNGYLKEPEKYEERFTAPNAKVLVVDDVRMNIDVFKGLLKKTLIQIDEANSGPKALSLIEKNKYDIIFMDDLMPDMGGVDVFKKMQETEHLNQGTPIIILTANVQEGAKEEYTDLGFDDYLAKPVRGKQLEDMIMYYLKEKQYE